MKTQTQTQMKMRMQMQNREMKDMCVRTSVGILYVALGKHTHGITSK